jgi:hypothetical protein
MAELESAARAAVIQLGEMVDSRTSAAGLGYRKLARELGDAIGKAARQRRSRPEERIELAKAIFIRMSSDNDGVPWRDVAEEAYAAADAFLAIDPGEPTR